MSVRSTRESQGTGFKAKTSNSDRWAVILAGGDGSRLRSFTRSCPMSTQYKEQS